MSETALKSAAAGMHDFSIDLYRRVASTRPGDFAFSPASISSAFALTWPGARGETAAELESALHFNGPPADVVAAHGALLSRSAPGCELATGNSVWIQKGIDLAPTYEQALRQATNMELISADFKSQPGKELARINDWVKERTRDRIQNLLPPGAIDPLTRLVLANAVYFKGTWKAPFTKAYTRNQPFHLLDGKEADVQMMQRTGRYPYLETPSAQILEMPYACGDVAMVVILPWRKRSESTPMDAPTDTLRQVEDALTSQQLQQWLNALEPKKVEISFPRFELDETLPLREEMEALGVRQAFTERADFSGISPGVELKISEAFHKTWMKVDEEGTEAAAATAMGMKSESVERTPSFVADHPFLFLIRDTKTGAVLFMGRMADPR